jgi:glycosyltransferase involved in cell wall biosynthesis
MRTCMMLPTLNEEIGIKKVIEDIPNPIVSDVIVLDGFSSDNTVINAKEANKKSFGVKVLFQEGTGKGMAFQSFQKNMNLDDYDIYVMLDADHTYDPSEVKSMISPIESGEADVVMGNRLSSPTIGNVMPFGSYLGNRMLNKVAHFLFRKNPMDMCTGYWAFTKDFMKKAKIRAKGFDLEANLFTEAVKRKFKIAAIDVSYRDRIGQKKLKYRDGLLIFLMLLKERLL